MDDIIAQFGENLVVFRGSLDRRSLRLQNSYLLSQAERMAWLAESIPDLLGNAVIYMCTNRDAPDPGISGRCGNCLGRPLSPETYSMELVNKAIQFLQRSD